MPDDEPHFDDAGRLIAPKYNDVYFSSEDGLAETQHVFLEGNRLAARLAELGIGDCFTIGETGFGTGLNFLAAWQLFEQKALRSRRLEFVSVEGWPLDTDKMRRALSPWPELEAYREALLQQWGALWPGMHRFRFAQGRVRLTVLVGEAAEALGSIDANVDAWFLDGFAPSRNADMWSENVFGEIARLSAGDATLATYTAAGHVRRGLGAVGYEIEKCAGFGTKRDMTVGNFKLPRQRVDPPASAIVIGGSIAGAFAARSLAERDVAVIVHDRQKSTELELPSLVPRVSALQPKINDASDPAGRWLREGYAYADRMLRGDSALAERAGWDACGSFQAAHDERAERRLRRFHKQFGGLGLCRWIDAEQTEAEVGVALPVAGLIIDDAGVLKPAGLCAGLLDHLLINVRYGSEVPSIKRDSDDVWKFGFYDRSGITRVVVLANALDAMRFDAASHLSFKPVRGQISLIDAAGQLAGLRRAIFYGGYVLPGAGGLQTLTLGASFMPGDAALEWRESEHDICCDKLARLLPQEADRIRQADSPAGWVGLRTTTPTHRCYAEQIEPGLYATLGHGSHGIASAAHAGEHLAALITGGVRTRSA